MIHPFKLFVDSNVYFPSCSILDSTNTIFWSLFGQIDPSSFKISEAEYGVIWRTGMTLFGAFNITAVLVALNMLIAILNDSYVQITVSCILKKLVISSVSYMLVIFVGSSKFRYCTFESYQIVTHPVQDVRVTHQIFKTSFC